MKVTFTLKSIAILLLLIFSVYPVAYTAEVVDRIVAVVNDDIITQSELEESMLPFVADYRVRYGEEELEEKIDEARRDALNRLIEEKLILQEAKRRGVQVDDAEIEKRIEIVKSRFGNEEEFYEAIRQSGVTLAKLKEKYREQIMMKNLVTGIISSEVSISPSQIAAYYYGNPQEFSLPPRVRFQVLLLKPDDERSAEETEALSIQVLDRVKAGDDFSLLVEEYSQGPNTDKGGDMGYMTEGSMIKEIEDELAKLKPGEISGIIKTSAGFYIIKVTERKEQETETLTEVTSLIRERLFQRESELTLREFMAELKKNAYIKIH